MQSSRLQRSFPRPRSPVIGLPRSLRSPLLLTPALATLLLVHAAYSACGYHTLVACRVDVAVRGLSGVVARDILDRIESFLVLRDNYIAIARWPAHGSSGT